MDYASTDVLTGFREKSYGLMSNPRVVAGYYIEAVSKRRECPAFMRGDNGTENGIVAQMQDFLSGNNTFFYGKSTGNQRIEMFWNFLRKECVQYWIDRNFAGHGLVHWRLYWCQFDSVLLYEASQGNTC